MHLAPAVVTTFTLAVSLVPAYAADRPPELQCSTFPCPYTLSGGTLELNFGASRVKCLAVAGNGQYRTPTIGVTALELDECREQVTVFHFRCSSTGQPNRPARTNPLQTQVMTGAGGEPKLQFMNTRLSLVCAGALRFHVEGYLISHIDQQQCNSRDSKYQVEPVLFAHGRIGSGPLYDVYVDSDDSTYRVPGPWRMQFSHNVILRC